MFGCMISFVHDLASAHHWGGLEDIYEIGMKGDGVYRVGDVETVDD